MRALLITCFPDSNGIGKYARIYGKNLESKGYVVDTLYLQTPRQFGKNLLKERNGILVKNFGLGVLCLFKEKVKEYLSKSSIYYDLYVVTTPILLRTTEVLPKERTEVIVLDMYAYKLENILKDFLASITQILFIMLYIKKPIRVIFISEYTRREFVKYTGRKICDISNKVFNIPLALLNTGIEKMELPNKLEGRYIFLNVGRDVANKNTKIFLELAKYYIKDASKVFVRVGVPSKRSAQYIERNSLDNVVHLDCLKEQELNFLYSTSKAYIHTSYYEGLGLPPLEAYVHGCYVIATKCSDLDIYLRNTTSYKFVDNPTDINEYIKTIDTITGGLKPEWNRRRLDSPT